MDYQWLEVNSFTDQLPPHVVVLQEDEQGLPLTLVGRAMHEGEPLMATVCAKNHCATISKYNQQYEKSTFKILQYPSHYWQACENGYIPHNAVELNLRPANSKQIFLGRTKVNGTQCLGEIEPARGVLEYEWKGQKFTENNYDILAVETCSNWVNVNFNFIPANAVVVGDSRLGPTYVGRALVEGIWMPARILPEEKTFEVVTNRYGQIGRQCQILCGNAFRWEKVYNNYIPEHAVASGTSARGQLLYVGRGQDMGYLQCGLISEKKKCLLLDWRSQVRDYEVLVDDCYL